MKEAVAIKQPLCAIYARVSTDEQEDSVAHQVSLLREFAKVRGLGVVPNEFIYEDTGVSATKISIWARPAMQRLLTDAEQGKFQTVLFKGISRFARSTQEALSVLELLKSKGLRVISYEENYDSSQENSNFLFTIHSAVAEYEAEKIGIRVKLGRKEAAKEGKWVGKVPFGYRIDENHRLVVHPEEAEIVRQIFDMYVNRGWGSFKIAQYLNEHNLTKRRWSTATVIDVLKNEVYIGNIVYNKRTVKRVVDYNSPELGKKKATKISNPTDDWVVAEGVHEPIIDKYTFLQAQKIRTSRRRGDTKPTATYLLTGIIRCKRCGQAMSGHVVTQNTKSGKKKWRYYTCHTANKYGRSGCDQPLLRKDKAENTVLERLKEKVENYNKEALKKNIDLAAENLNKLRDELKKVEQKIDLTNKKTADLFFEKENMTEEQYEYLSTRLRKEMEQLLLRKDELQKEIELSEVTEEQRKRIESDIHSFLGELNSDELDEGRLRVLIHRLIERIDVDGNKLQIKYRFNF